LVAACFCGLGRFEQTRNALNGVVANDAADVESLCALAALDAKVSQDGVGNSMEYLGEAVKADQNHPVVLSHLANHAFYCGLEDAGAAMGVQESASTPASWEQAGDLLNKALANTRSQQVRAEVHYQLGRLHHAQGRFAKATEEYGECHRLYPEHLACAYGLAQTCVQQQRFAEAVKTLEAMGPGREMPEVLKLLTFAYLMCGDKAKEAAKCADALVAKSKDDAEAWAMRAEANDQLAAQEPAQSTPKAGIEAYEHVARVLSGGGPEKTGCASPQLWNNLGTLRSLQGDPDGAKEAYGRGLELVEKRLVGEGGPPASDEEAKDLQVARLTMRFNRAWLAESLGDQPNFAQATRDYMTLSEEHGWYADTLLRLGAQWQRVGESDAAVQRYQEAMRQSPVMAALMQAEVYRHKAEYSKALQSAETAVRCAGEKQFHYAHVSLGNLYYEVAGAAATKQSDRDAYMKKALWNFTRALEHEKDSHYAANGIGMVFAQRGKLDFAKRTFQSVMQHHAMAGDPSVYINLGHTYLRSGGDDARKAIALYLRALKLRPDDLSIRLYLAKAHFSLKEFEKCSGVLGDAMQIWPDDLLLRYNLAVSLESFGVHLVSMEKKTKRVVGVDSGMDQMEHAVSLLSAAARLYGYVDARWVDMAEPERKRLASKSGAPANLQDEMRRVSLHKEYCADITTRARDELEKLKLTRKEMDERMHKIVEDREHKEKSQQATQAEEKKRDDERRLEMEEQAIHIMDSTRDIQLGKFLGELKDSGMKAMAKASAKDSKGKPTKASEKRQRKAGQRSGDSEGASDGPMAPGGSPAPAREGEPGAGGEPSPGEVAPGGLERKDKKDKKKKKEKKDKKKDKKDKKRERSGTGEGEQGESGDELELEEVEPLDAQAPEEGAEVLPLVEEEEEPREEGRKDKKEKKDKKKDKGEKKDKKSKKDKKDKKRRKQDDDSLDDGDGEGSPLIAPRTNEDVAMEEELFGPDE